MRRIDMRTVKFCRSMCDVEARFKSGSPNAAIFSQPIQVLGE